MKQHSQWLMVGLVIFAVHSGVAWSEETGKAAVPAAAQSSSTPQASPPAAPAPQAPAPAAAQNATPAAQASQASAPAATPAAPVPAAPVLRPIVIKFSGELMQMTKEGAQPSLTVKDRYGVTKEMSADPASVKITRGTDPATLDDLKQGDQVTVDYTYDVATGKRFVQAITVGTAAAKSGSSS